ncbi:MAG: c-type cytochrome [Pseudomonadota bacterium]
MKKFLLMLCVSVGTATAAHAASTEQRYAQSCASCHNAGVMAAPKKGDKAAWAPRLKQGEATLLARVKNGYKMMPPKGLCNDCTDAEFKALIKFMSK